MLTARSFVTVKPAGVVDALSIAEVFRLSWLNTYAAIIPQSHLEYMVKRRGVAWWRSAIRSRDTVNVLKFDGRIVGYATCGSSRDSSTYEGEIYEIYLLPEYQGAGLGELLFEACRHHLDERRLRGMIVWCLADNTRAMEFYERRGGVCIASSHEMLGGTQLEKIALAWED